MKKQEKQIEFEKRVNCGIAYCEDTPNKQIEEIQGLLFCNKWEQPFTDCEENIKCIECIAKQIYNAGYRKIDKDSVVLSKEELNTIQANFFDSGIKCGSKETAEKFLQLAYDRCLEKSFIKKVEELAKSLGVEIKE
jgi:hypothetical protein